jgi:CubicO group peptidase (beta-lactamase class C family)
MNPINVMRIGLSLTLLLSCLALSSSVANTVAHSTPSTKSEQDLGRRIQRIENGLLLPVAIRGQSIERMKLADRMSFYKTPGVSIAFIDDGRIAWVRGYGVRAVASGEHVTTETLFQAGSISKPVAAAMALHLVERERLSIDGDVNEKLVSWKVPENEFTKLEKVTVRRILSHSAGLTNHAAGNYRAGADLPTLVQILDGIEPANTPPIRVDAIPGSLWRYSGGGYGVLQQLVIDAGGKPFEVQARETIFEPLDMTSSTFEQPLPAQMRERAAVGHDRSGKRIEGEWITFPEMAAAGLWSTPSDLARLAIELQQSRNGKSNRILGAEITRQMLTRQIENWGLGFVVEGEGRSARFSHGGDTEGYKCLLVMYHTGQGAVVMTNSDRGDRLTDEIMRSIAHEYGWGDYQPKEKSIARINPSVYADYIGQYQFEFSSDYVLTIIAEGGYLMTELKQPTGQARSELFPESETKFFRKDVDVEVTFVKGESNRVTHLVFRQDGQEYRVNRIE